MSPRHLPLALFLAACSKDKGQPPASSPSEVTADERARAATVVAELKKSLVGALQGALAQGAPSAIDACHSMAPGLAAALSRDGIVVGRATRKPRNPKNEASGWQAEAIDDFERARTANKLAGATFTRRLPDGRAAYAEPLVIQELCLTCHGGALAPEVQTVLAQRYPGDKATGYVLGDLRGVAWVELPAGAAGTAR